MKMYTGNYYNSSPCYLEVYLACFIVLFIIKYHALGVLNFIFDILFSYCKIC